MNSNNPFTTYGRTTRTRYIAAIIGLFLLWILMRSAVTVYAPSEAFVRIVLSIAILWPGYCITVMRLHDTDRTSIFAIVAMTFAVLGILFEATDETLAFDESLSDALVAITALITLFCIGIAAILPPTRGANRYGSDPRGKLAPRERAAALQDD